LFLKTLLESPAINVFLGTLPLLLTLAWGLFANNQRLNGIEKRLDRIDDRLDRMETKIEAIDVRLVRVETRLEGKQVVLQ
jgi:hypothetical protein